MMFLIVKFGGSQSSLRIIQRQRLGKNGNEIGDATVNNDSGFFVNIITLFLRV